MIVVADSHVHSEFSWDTGGPDSSARGAMEATCARAVRIGLPALFFTEHLDLEDIWFSDPEDFGDRSRHLLDADGRAHFPPFDADGYFESINRCRAAFPQLHIGTGLEVGQPHLWLAKARQQLDLARFDRVLGSLHTLQVDGGRRNAPNTLFRRLPAEEVVHRYLSEIPTMVSSSEPFEIVSHLDYVLRYWPEEKEGPVDPRRFESQLRAAMRAISESGRALEMNTRRLWPWIVQWWKEEGGRSLSFASDAHRPSALAHGFPEAIAMVEQYGFRAGEAPHDLWRR